MRALMSAAALAIALVLLALPSPAQSDEPMLAIRQVGDVSSIYAVSEIQRIEFEGDTLVVVSEGGADSYVAGEIIRIEFLWGFSGIRAPEDAAGVLKVMHLFQNQPNPFSPETRIEFDLPRPGRVELGIYSVDGRRIRSLLDEARLPGPQTVVWDGRDDTGQRMPGGVYFYDLAAQGIKESRQMILLP